MKAFLPVVLFAVTGSGALAQGAPPSVKLPEPRRQGAMSVEAALAARQSVRALTRDSITLADAGQLLWAAQGVNRPNGHRTAPSAGATYPLELYLVASRVSGLPGGVYHYGVAGHVLEPAGAGDRLREFVDGLARQAWIADAAAVLVFTAVYGRTAQRYRARAERFVPMEVGHAAQNVYLQAVALGLGTTFVGYIQDTAAARILALPADRSPLGLMPVGRPR
jgi:SagB-type dehydrogenase family enzyme